MHTFLRKGGVLLHYTKADLKAEDIRGRRGGEPSVARGDRLSRERVQHTPNPRGRGVTCIHQPLPGLRTVQCRPGVGSRAPMADVCYPG